MQVTCVLLTAAAALTCFLPQSDQFIPIGTISELCCLIDKAENVSAVTSKFLEIVNFTKLILLSVDVTLLLISSEIIEICQILSEEFEKTLVLGADSRPLRHRDKAASQAGGGRGRKSNYPCVNPASKTDIDPAIIQFFPEFSHFIFKSSLSVHVEVKLMS